MNDFMRNEVAKASVKAHINEIVLESLKDRVAKLEQQMKALLETKD